MTCDPTTCSTRWLGHVRLTLIFGLIATMAGVTVAQPVFTPGGTPQVKRPNGRVDLVSGATFEGAIDYPGDVDSFLIHAEAGETLYCAFWDDNPNTSFYAVVDLYAPDGSFVAGDFDQNGLEFNAVAPMTGTYRYEIYDSNHDTTAGYVITAVIPDDHVDVGNVALTSGETESGFLDYGEFDTYTIHANAGETIYAAFWDDNPNTGFYAEVDLYAPDGTFVARDFDQNGLEFNAIAPMTGTYTFVVYDGNADMTAEYVITAVVPDGQVDAGNVALTSGETESGFLDYGEFDTYTIHADAGETIYCAFRDENPNTSFYAEVDLYAPDGTFVARDFDQNGLEFNAIAPMSGTYTFVVYDGNADTTSEYVITAVVPDADVDAGNVALTSGLTVSGTLEYGEFDTYTIHADAGETIYCAFWDDNPNTSFYAEVDLYAPDGTFVMRDFDQNGLEFNTIAPMSGTYTFVVYDGNADTEAGYVITAVVPDDDVDAGNVGLSSGQTVGGSLQYGEFDTFTIFASAGDTLHCTFVDDNPNTSFYASADLYAPDGTYVARDFGQNGFEFAPVVPTTGTYTFVVYDINADTEANYEFTVTRLP